MILSIIWLGMIAAVLIGIYKKLKIDDEDNAGWKVFGYYILGGFRINFPRLVIPAGFLIYLLCFRPEKNRKMKRAAAIFGLVICIVGGVIPAAKRVYFEMERRVKISSSNMNNIDLKGDYEKIKDKLHLKGDLRIGNLQAWFKESGKLNSLRYNIKRRGKGGTEIFRVSFQIDNEEYRIRGSKEQWERSNDPFKNMYYSSEEFQYDYSMSDEEFFFALDRIDINKVVLKAEGDFILESDRKIQVEDKMYQVIKIGDRENTVLEGEHRKISGYGFSLWGMSNIEGTGYSGIHFILPYESVKSDN